MFTQQITELQDLVGKPAEREWLELKSWIDLTDKAARAGIARHLAAIANYGGGYLVFGFNDDGTRCAVKEDVRKFYSHDVLAGIIDRYLRPKFQCDVQFESCEGVEHPVVWIPAHGPSPVSARADGPHDEKGQPQGIRSGQVYIRTPKPESVPVTTPEQWDKLIQRCVLSRRDELIEMFAAIVSGGAGAQRGETAEREKLAEWHRATQKAFLKEVAGMELERRFPVVENFLQFSYMIRTRRGAVLPADRAFEILEKAQAATRDTVRYGWSMFYPFTRAEIMPRFMTDAGVDDGQTEFLQTSMAEKSETGSIDFWRIALDGRVSLIRDFREDRRVHEELGEDAKWFDPWLHVRDVTELARHARAFSEEWEEVEEICFDIQWKGLRGRTLAAGNRERYGWRPHRCEADERGVALCFTQAEVIGNLPAVVSSLYAPVHRLFDPRFNASPEWVSAMLPQFIVPGL